MPLLRRSRSRLAASTSVAVALALALLAPALAAPARPAKVTIEAGKPAGAVSSLLFGHFVEFMYQGIKEGLHAELLRSRSFEEPPNVIGLSGAWERDPDDRNDDYFLKFAWDDAVAYPGRPGLDGKRERSLRIDLKRTADGRRRGVRQGGVPVRAGVPYRGYLWVRAPGYRGALTVALEADRTGGETYASARLTGFARGWKKLSFSLTPKTSDPLAKFVILIEGEGRLWIDQVSLMPGDAEGGVRADVMASARPLRPAFIRWPGGNVAQDYRWRWGVGPRDQRVTWTNTAWSSEPEPSDFGTDEFIRFSRRLGAEPSITVNVEGRGATAEEAAAWVEYANGAVTTPMGKLRAKHGHPEPYGVKLWEVGNEMWGHWVTANTDAETYAKNLVRYATAMRKVDPTIQIIAVGDQERGPGTAGPADAWNRTVLRVAGHTIDYLALHHYYGLAKHELDTRNIMARPLEYERWYRSIAKLARELVPGREIKLAINEWNTQIPEPRQHGMEAALFGARLMNVFERNSDVVAMSAVSDLVNGWYGGIIQVSRHGLFVTAGYLVHELYARHAGATRLPAAVTGPTVDTPDEGKRVPVLDVSATRAADGKRIFVKAVNTDARALTVTFDLRGASARRASVETLAARSLGEANTFAKPDTLKLKARPVEATDPLVVELPRHSVSVVTIETR